MKPRNEFFDEFFFQVENLQKKIASDDNDKKTNYSLFDNFIKEKNLFFSDQIEKFFVDIINHLKKSKENLLKEKDDYLNNLKKLLNFTNDEDKKKINKEFNQFQISLERNKNDPSIILINYLKFKTILENFENYKKDFDKNFKNIKITLNENLKNIKIDYNIDILKPIGILNKENIDENKINEITTEKNKESLLFDNLLISEIEDNCSNLIKEGEKEDFLLINNMPKFESSDNILNNKKSLKEINLFMDQSIGNISELNESKIQNIDFENLEDRFEEKIKKKKKYF